MPTNKPAAQPPHWNHRVVRSKDPCGEYEYAIHEAYYGLKGAKREVSITDNPTPVHSDTKEGLRQVLEWMLKCLDRPVLDAETLEEIEES